MICSVNSLISITPPILFVFSASPRLRGEKDLCRLGDGGLLLGTQEAQELHLDYAGIVAGLDAQYALEQDLLGENFFVASHAQLFRDRPGDEILQHATIERAGERDRQGASDLTRVAVEM